MVTLRAEIIRSVHRRKIPPVPILPHLLYKSAYVAEGLRTGDLRLTWKKILTGGAG